MVDFKKLKKESGSTTKLEKAIESLNVTASYNEDEDKFWRLEVDKTGNGSAVIRFLTAPAVDGDDGLPWVKYFAHGFKNQSGAWLIANCPTTLGEQCPVCDHNSKLWATGVKATQDIVRDRKRKLNYVSNIYIVSDPKHPENNGKVFLFRYGKKIHDKLLAAASPAFEDQKKFDPFDFWTGATFRLRSKKVDGFQSYEESIFDAPGPLLEDDAAMEAIWKAEYSLKDLVAPEKFPKYDDLKKRLDKLLGEETGSDDSAPKVPKTVEQARAHVSKMIEKDNIVEPPSEDDSLSYFQKLAENN